MSIELTPEQQHALDNQVSSPQRVVDPRTDTAYVLVPEGEYEATRELLEDERREQVIQVLGSRDQRVAGHGGVSDRGP